MSTVSSGSSFNDLVSISKGLFVLLIISKNDFRLPDVMNVSLRISDSVSIPLQMAVNSRSDRFWKAILSIK